MIKNVTPSYTGGGIYSFIGELTNHTFFLADNWDVRILTEDPRIDEYESFFPEWQEERLVADLTGMASAEFLKEVIRWIKENEPEGNYLMSDMDELYIEVSERGVPGEE